MMPLTRIAPVALAALAAAALLAGCNRPRGPAAGGPAGPAARTDYRTLGAAGLQGLIASKTGSEVKDLKEAGPNRFTGTIVAPGGDPLPLTVTVEEQRVVCETKMAAGSTRQIITPQGVTSDLDVR